MNSPGGQAARRESAAHGINDGRSWNWVALDTAAGYKYTGSGFFTSISISGGVEDAPTFSVSIDGTGALTQTAV